MVGLLVNFISQASHAMIASVFKQKSANQKVEEEV